MASSPMGPDAEIVVQLADPADTLPDAPMEAFLYDGHGQGSRMIAGSFGTADVDFFWMLGAVSAFHKIPLVDMTGRQV